MKTEKKENNNIGGREMKVVINRDYGGYALSEIAKDLLGIEHDNDIERDDPRLVEIVEKLGKEANTSYSNLLVVEIPDDMPFYIHEYDGFEVIHEKHRVFPSVDMLFGEQEAAK